MRETGCPLLVPPFAVIWVIRRAALLCAMASSILVACSNNAGTTPTPQGTATESPELAQLASLADKALQRAHGAAVDAILRQVDIISDGRYIFRFINGTASEEITVLALDAGAPADTWSVTRGVSPLIGRVAPALQISALRVVPSAVWVAAKKHWRGCEAPSLTVYGQGDALSVTVFCDTPKGMVDGSMDNATGAFHPSDAPPAQQPPTATPR